MSGSILLLDTQMASSEMKNAYNTKILDLARYNGRVNLMSQPDPAIQFQLAEKVAVKNKATEYRGALTGEWEDNVLAQVFFSAENIQIIQNGIRAGVYEKSGQQFTVMPQNPDTLKIVMRSIYLQYAQHYPTGITAQVERLNLLVLNYAVPNVFNESVGYLKYCEDISTLAVPFALPQQVDRDFRELESGREFFINNR